MYPITCLGGFNVPARQGKFEVTGFSVTLSDATAASQFAIIDDPAIQPEWECGRIIAAADLTYQKNILCNLVRQSGAASLGVDANLTFTFPEPIKTRFGLSICGNNFVLGSVCVYRR